ncbi:MAG: electron transfer flavoprotein subunit beta/FixA family protein [Methanobacteriota archaeon]
MPLDVVVCLKQVPNPDLQFRVAPDGRDIRREALNYKTNAADEVALEEGVRLKERHGGRVVALTAGPKRADSVLREALAKGADDAVRVTVDDAASFDVGRTARILAAALRTVKHDLVLTGVQSDDLGGSASGVLVAGFLGIAHASVVTRVEVKGPEIEVACELEGGVERVVALPLPALLTIQFGANVPRYAPLPAIMKAARAPIREVGPSVLGAASWDALSGPYAFRVRRLSPPPSKGRAELVTGTVAEQAKRLARLLREKGFVRG